MTELLNELNRLTDERPQLYYDLFMSFAHSDSKQMQEVNSKIRVNYDLTVKVITKMEDWINAKA